MGIGADPSLESLLDFTADVLKLVVVRTKTALDYIENTREQLLKSALQIAC
ncbi:MAG TPA: hypothetical protein PK867_03395 [Pirellulales bacterium]|nr:hypothetical protein [Pirellulales bacterium]